MSTKQCVNCPGAVDHTTAECPISPERAAPPLPAAGSAELPEPDFTLDGGSQPCYYAETVQQIVAALSAQEFKMSEQVRLNHSADDVDQMRKDWAESFHFDAPADLPGLLDDYDALHAEAEALRKRARPAQAAPQELRIVLDGPPGPEAGRFVEVENAAGRSVNAGEWRERADGLWELVLHATQGGE